jgi:hypothetical protein
MLARPWTGAVPEGHDGADALQPERWRYPAAAAMRNNRAACLARRGQLAPS